ncbi:MAG: VanZ family protein [Acidobacteriota bacterium]|nr:VanZ family protein [Acidobacteriota bacterium]
MLIRRNYHVQNDQLKNVEIELEHAFTDTQPVSFTITSGPQGALAYRNGVRVGASKRMGLSCKDLSGELVIGNSPVSDNPWQGTLLDLAIYDRELQAQDVAQNFAAEQSERTSEQNKNDVVAHYDFAQASGDIIHNVEGPAPDLYIPAHFKILHKKVLSPPWLEYRGDSLYVEDLAINIIGFIPFGFLFCAYWSLDRTPSQAAFLTVAAGFVISVTIEILQVFIPSRTSGMTDIITNTFGSWLGVLLFSNRATRAIFAKLAFSGSGR